MTGGAGEAVRAGDARALHEVRGVHDADAPAIARLLGQLGYPVHADDVPARLARLRAAGERVLVACRGGAVCGVLALQVRHALHRAQPVGVLSVLVVDEAARGAGIGRALVAAGERALAEAGCGLVTVASNRSRSAAHAFYASLGYEATSVTFRKALSAAAP